MPGDRGPRPQPGPPASLRPPGSTRRTRRREAIGLAAVLGWQRLDQLLALQTCDRSVQSAWAQAGPAHLRDVVDHGVAVLGPVRQAGQHQQWRVRVMAEARVILALYSVSR